MYKEEKSQLEIFSENLREAMFRKGMSQNALSRKLNCSASTVNSWCKGQTMPRPAMLEKISQILNVQRGDLMVDKASIPNLSVPAAYPLPMLGRICAGNGIVIEQNYQGQFFVDHTIKADYCVRVEGDSMKDAEIHHGDVAFIRSNFEFVDGHIYAVVFGVEESASLKQVYRQGKGFMLAPCNPRYSPFYMDAVDVYIIGECIGVYHPR